MGLYRVCVVLHVVAMSLWIGHMVFWSLIVGPLLKRMEPPAEAQRLRAASLRWGGLGWPALIVLVPTGVFLAGRRGVTIEQIASGALFSDPSLSRLGWKLVLVLGMVIYQVFIGHRPAPKLVYANMLAAFAIVALSVWIARVA